MNEKFNSLTRSDTKAARIVTTANERDRVTVGQVRDSVGVERIDSFSSFAIVTQVTFGKMLSTVTYDLVTDFGIIRAQRCGLALFRSMFPTIYIQHVREAELFAADYRNI